MKNLKLAIMSVVFMLMGMPGYVSCVKQEIVEPNKKIVIMGDSMVKTIDGQLSGEPSTWEAELGMSDVDNQGYNGIVIQQVSQNGPLTWTIAANPELVYIAAGINDAIQGVSVATSIAPMTTICNQLTSNGIPFVITLPVPVVHDYTYNNVPAPGIRDNREALNAALVNLCVSHGYRYMDLEPWLGERHADGHVYLKDEYTVDGVHLNNAGYKCWAMYMSYDINQH